MVSGWSGSSFSRSIICFAGTAIFPSSVVFSVSIWVLSVSSESDAVISSTFPFRSKRKFSSIGRGDFAGIAFDTDITPFRSSELEIISFMTSNFNFYCFYGALPPLLPWTDASTYKCSNNFRQGCMSDGIFFDFFAVRSGAGADVSIKNVPGCICGNKMSKTNS